MLTTIRAWALNQGVTFDESDIEFCINNGIELDVQQAEVRSIETGNGQVFHYRSAPGVIKLITSNNRSEAMLQLRYSNKVTLFSRIMTDTVSMWTQSKK